MSKVFALIDCNNFYVSCERVFNPMLEGKPVLILSNNDGCIVARSNESKQLGIAMGVPVFKIKDLIRKHNIQVWSSNYTLYGDLSYRVQSLLEEFSPKVEVYSIDECFVDFAGKDVDDALQLKAIIKQWTGLPVAIGIGPTKTLAKVANRIAKRSGQGVFALACDQQLEQILETIAVGDIWGIGHRLAERLQQVGITQARQLRDADDRLIKKLLGVVGLRTVLELRGFSCLPLELAPSPRQSCVVSRSFARPIETLLEMKEAVATFTAKAAYKLRKDNLAAQHLTVFVSTSRFKDPYYSNKKTTSLPVATNHTQELISYALALTEQLYRKGLSFSKAGVIMMKLVSDDHRQLNLFDTRDREQAARLLQDMDQINEQMERGTLRYAAEGLKQGWQTRAEKRSPRWTTQWGELPVVKA